MEKYTWEDIIINPKLEVVKSYIGQEVYYANNPTECLRHANNNSKQFAKLNNINDEVIAPFIVNVADFLTSESNFVCIIPKKEELKLEYKYVPFDNIEELIEASLEHNKNHYLSKIGGLWLKNKKYGAICLITSTVNDYLFFDSEPYDLDNIFDYFCFLDNTPCGKLME